MFVGQVFQSRKGCQHFHVSGEVFISDTSQNNKENSHIFTNIHIFVGPSVFYMFEHVLEALYI